MGDWVNGSPHGNGTFYLPTGMRFEGEFEHGQMRGRGTIFHADGTVQTNGDWGGHGSAGNTNDAVASGSSNTRSGSSTSSNNRKSSNNNNSNNSSRPRQRGVMESLSNFFYSLLGYDIDNT